MNRNILYLVLGALVVGIAVLGYLYYEEEQSGVEIQIDDSGVEIDGN
ncbi:hypothetical protein ACVDG3_19865 [Meridianimarinicoccus sp. RP-17]|nr:hypothetical protein [Phycocomes zhengii]